MVPSECIEGGLTSALIDGLRKLKGLPFKPSHLMDFKNHETESMAGWIGLTSWTVQTNDCQLWDVDWRYAFGSEVFKQNLIDFGLDEQKYLYRYKRKDQKCHKLVIYICYSGMDMPEYYSGFTDCKKDKHLNSHTLEIPTWNPIPERYLIGKFWQSVHRCLIPIEILPLELQQLLPETLPKSLELPYGDFVTTYSLQNTSPETLNNPEKEMQTVLELSKYPSRKGVGGQRTKGLFKGPGDVANPIISVVTVVYNDVKYIEQTIQSVINQTESIIEYIVIDGGSTDGTLDIIRQYENQIDYWVSEPDKGIYDAMNKGLSLASGNWINFMNSGDLFYSPDTIKQLFDCVIGDEKIIYGNVHIRYEDFARVELASNPRKLWRGMQFSHQSVFCDLEYQKKNLFNINNKICADLEFYYKAYKKQIKFKHASLIVSSVQVGGVSESNRLATLKLSNAAVSKGGALPIVNLYYFYKYIDTICRSYLKLILPKWIVRKLIQSK
jgi:glycosyltransferase involved in cell wall biosynthesis